MEIEQNTPIQEDVVMEDSIPFPEPIMQPPLIDDRDKKKQRLDKPLPPPTTTATKNGDSSLPPSVTAALSPEQTVGIITVNTQSILYENQEPPQGKPVSPQTDQQLKIEMEIEPTQTNIPPKIIPTKIAQHVETDLDDARSDTTMSSAVSQPLGKTYSQAVSSRPPGTGIITQQKYGVTQ
ncbi:hypothetical protein C2G38_2043269 [Gigaspora rosea]|uniref:Uncharacterized protein n=1 Tax=Gigaspora rosea TaxID=44941 RepID=A0A397UN97_9GLOM|nr:hypothetical protein C2G38_2043269 [Gigaspora rosea]